MRSKIRKFGKRTSLHRDLRNARRALLNATLLLDGYDEGDQSGVNEAGQFLDDAATAIYLARTFLLENSGSYVRSESKKTVHHETLFGEETQPSQCTRSLPCGDCGHRTLDHTEGLRCIVCGCRTFIEVEDPDQTGLGFCAVEHEGPCEYPESHGERR